MPSLIKRGLHTWEPIAHTAIQNSIEAGSSLLVLSKALLVQVRAATFGTSLFPPTVNLVEESGTHTASNADLSLLLELHSLQAETAADTNTDHFNQLRRRQCRRLRLQRSTLPFLLSTRLLHVKKHYQFYVLVQTLSETPTHTNIQGGVRHWAGQAIFPSRDQSCRGPLFQLVFPLSIRHLSPWPVKSIDEYHLFESSSTVSPKYYEWHWLTLKRSPSVAALRRYRVLRQNRLKCLWTTSCLSLLVTENLVPSWFTFYTPVHRPFQIDPKRGTMMYLINCAKSLSSSDTCKKTIALSELQLPQKCANVCTCIHTCRKNIQV